MSRVTERRWPWFHQAVDAIAVMLAVAIVVTNLVRDSWPPIAVIFALVCLGKVGSTAFLKTLMNRWTP